MIVAPPSNGAVQLTRTALLPGVAVTPLGVSGGDWSVAVAETAALRRLAVSTALTE